MTFTPKELNDINNYLNGILPDDDYITYFRTHRKVTNSEFWLRSLGDNALYETLTSRMLLCNNSYSIEEVLAHNVIENTAEEYALSYTELLSVIRYHSFKSLFFHWGRIRMLHNSKYKTLSESVRKFLQKWDPTFYNYHIEYSQPATYETMLDFTCIDAAIRDYIKEEIREKGKQFSLTAIKTHTFATLLDNSISWANTAIAKKIPEGGQKFFSSLARIEANNQWNTTAGLNDYEKKAVDTFAEFLRKPKETIKSAYEQKTMFYTNKPEELMFQ